MGSSRNSPSSDFASLPPHAAVCVGFSGGVDSTVLLDLMARHGRATGRRVTAVHVHHGLSPNADAWARSCEVFCAARGVELTVERVQVERGSADGLEAAARRARYAVYADRKEPIVALAHHRDDQAETVLLQLLRGTGLKGVCAMPELRALSATGVQLYRPLLSYSRAQLAEYARDAGLAWIEDESNDSAVHDRNYLRHAVAPALDARFPAWRDALARFARHAASADGLLDEMARDDGPDDDPGLAWDGPHKAMYLHVTLDDERRANALRSFLQRNELPMPASARLVEMARQLYDARDDATVRIEHAGVALVRHRGRAVIESPVAPVSWRVEWRGEPEVELGGDRGCIWIQPGSGEGIDPQRVGQGEWHFGSRMGGERMRLDPAGSTRTLKNLLQEKGLSIRQRQVFPCLFHDGRLVWMSGVGIEADYRVAEGRDGLLPHWRMAFAPSPVLK